MNTMGKKILYIARVDLPDGNALARRVIANCIMIKNIGYEPYIVGYTHSRDKMGNGEVNGIPYFAYQYPTTAIEWLSDLLNLCKNVKYDHMKNGAPLAMILCCIGSYNSYNLYRWANKNKVATAVDSVDYFRRFQGNIIERLIKKTDQSISVFYVNRRIKNNICISLWYKHLYDKKGCNTVVIPSLNGCNLNFVNRYNTTSTLRFIYVGNPGYQCSKDRLDWCIGAFMETNYLRNGHLDIYGVSKEQYCLQCTEQAELLQATSNIVFHGVTPNTECQQAIINSDFFVFAREDNINTRAGFPTKLSEAFACGTPVITTPSGDVSMYITHGENGFISQECSRESFIKAWTDAIAINEAELIDMHRNCRNNQTLNIEKWEPLFRNFIEKTLVYRENNE